jgi:phosphoenolpyruvate phosphomutase
MIEARIRAAKRAKVTEEFMVIVRLESLVAGAGLRDGLARAEAYVAAGADGLVVPGEFGEVEDFCAWCRELPEQVPLFAMPGTFSGGSDTELVEAGISGVVYADHLLRSAYPAMLRTAQTILATGRATEVVDEILPQEDLMNLIKGSL